MRKITKYQMEVNTEKIEDMKNMILHDSFFLEVGNSYSIRVVRVIGGLLYIDKDSSMKFVSF